MTGVQTCALPIFFEHLVLPKLLPLLQTQAPGLILHSRSAEGRLPKEQLEQGQFDVAIAGFFGDLPDGFYKRKLYEDHFVCIVREGHPRIGKSLTLDQYLAERHVLISPQGDLRGVIDVQLEKKKKKRQVIAGISNFLTPGGVIAASDCVLTVPSRLAEVYRQRLPIKVMELPLTAPPVVMLIAWHERTHRDPLHQWFRDKIVQCIES